MNASKNMDDPIHVISILWGKKYTEKDVNRLYSMIQRNSVRKIQFHVFSDETLSALNPSIRKHPEPGLRTSIQHAQYNYRKEAALCDDNLGGLRGKRVFFFDLDVLIMEEIDSLFDYPKGDDFYIINDWNTTGDHVGQASCYSFVVGTLGFVKDAFETAPEKTIETFGTASQEYLSAKVIEKWGSLNFWPEEWFQSFRYHCLPHPLLRYLQIAHKPRAGTKVLAFHGHPDLKDAQEGRWPEKKKHRWKIWKKLYKHCNSTPWIDEYWH